MCSIVLFTQHSSSQENPRDENSGLNGTYSPGHIHNSDMAHKPYTTGTPTYSSQALMMGHHLRQTFPIKSETSPDTVKIKPDPDDIRHNCTSSKISPSGVPGYGSNTSSPISLPREKNVEEEERNTEALRRFQMQQMAMMSQMGRCLPSPFIGAPSGHMIPEKSLASSHDSDNSSGVGSDHDDLDHSIEHLMVRKPRKGTPHKISSPGADHKSTVSDTIIPTSSHLDDATSVAVTSQNGNVHNDTSPSHVTDSNQSGSSKANETTKETGDSRSDDLNNDEKVKNLPAALDLTANFDNSVESENAESDSQTLFLFGAKYDIHKNADGHWGLKNELDLLNVLESFLSTRKSSPKSVPCKTGKASADAVIPTPSCKDDKAASPEVENNLRSSPVLEEEGNVTRFTPEWESAANFNGGSVAEAENSVNQRGEKRSLDLEDTLGVQKRTKFEYAENSDCETEIGVGDLCREIREGVAQSDADLAALMNEHDKIDMSHFLNGEEVSLEDLERHRANFPLLKELLQNLKKRQKCA
jgi:hypothetical protein